LNNGNLAICLQLVDEFWLHFLQYTKISLFEYNEISACSDARIQT